METLAGLGPEEVGRGVGIKDGKRHDLAREKLDKNLIVKPNDVSQPITCVVRGAPCSKEG